MNSKVKLFLKKILPSSIAKSESLNQQTLSIALDNKKGIDEMFSCFDPVLKQIYYNNDFERIAINDFFDIEKQPGFEELFIQLTSDMETESIAAIVQILKRLQLIKDTAGRDIDIFTQEEKANIRRLVENYTAYNYKISENLFCYKNYLLPIDHFESDIFFDNYGIDKLDTVKKTRNKNIVDAGAFIGDSLLVLSSLTDKKIYAFEPVAKNFILMKKTIELNNIKNAVAENLALGSKKEKLKINVSGDASSVFMPLSRKVDHQEEVQVLSLDDYVEERGLDIGLIKVDIEGYEQEFLKGAENTIRQQKPILLISIYHNPDDFFKIKPILQSWGLGYKFKIHRGTNFGCILLGTLLIAEPAD